MKQCKFFGLASLVRVSKVSSRSASLVVLLWLAIALPANAALRADKILIEKKEHRLTLLADGREIKHYSIALGKRGLKPKTTAGDGRTPEGLYVIDWRNPKSKFYRALHISYPTPQQRDQAKKEGRDPGGAIMIHGLKNGTGLLGAVGISKAIDWTDGCVAVTDKEMDEIWSAVPNGTPVEIQP